MFECLQCEKMNLMKRCLDFWSVLLVNKSQALNGSPAIIHLSLSMRGAVGYLVFSVSGRPSCKDCLQTKHNKPQKMERKSSSLVHLGPLRMLLRWLSMHASVASHSIGSILKLKFLKQNLQTRKADCCNWAKVFAC